MVPISEKDWEFFSSKLIKREFAKESIILKVGHKENYLSFIEKGIVRKCIPQEFDDLTFENNAAIAQKLMDLFTEGTYDKIVLVYNKFKSVISQVPTFSQLIPLPIGSDSAKDKAGFHNPYLKAHDKN